MTDSVLRIWPLFKFPTFSSFFSMADALTLAIFNLIDCNHSELVIDTAKEVLDDFIKDKLYYDAIKFAVTVVCRLIEKSESYLAAQFVNYAINAPYPYQANLISMFSCLALCYPTSGQPITAIKFFLKLILLTKDRDTLILRHLIEFVKSNLNEMYLIQKLYILLYSKCFPSWKLVKGMTDEFHNNFALFLWSIARSTSDQLTISAIFLRAILYIMKEANTQDNALCVASDLYNAIIRTKPDDIFFDVLNNPYYRFINFFLKALKSNNEDACKKVLYCYQKIILHDYEIAIMVDSLSKQFFPK